MTSSTQNEKRLSFKTRQWANFNHSRSDHDNIDLTEEEMRARLHKNYSLSVFDELKRNPKCDDNWHENELLTKTVVQQKIDEYMETFTIHGLTRVFTCGKVEAVFWAVILTLGLLCCGFIVHTLVARYLRHEVYSQVSKQVVDQKPFPSVTVCEYDLLLKSFFAYCGEKERNRSESRYCIGRPPRRYYPNISENDNGWSNGGFNVTSCNFDNMNCNNGMYFQSSQKYGPGCFVWNYNGNYTNTYSHVQISFNFTRPKEFPRSVYDMDKIIAFFHDPGIQEIDLTKQVNIDPGKRYDITIEKTSISRLPAPFPSNCSDDLKNHIFPGKYTRRSCIESNLYVSIYKACGDMFDYIEQYIPDDIKRQYRKNISEIEALKCFDENRRATTSSKDCPFPCTEMELSVVSTFTNYPDKELNQYTIDIQYENVDTMNLIEEKELYSVYQMACEIGGFLGLVIGASIISFIELFTYIGLCIISRCFM